MSFDPVVGRFAFGIYQEQENSVENSPLRTKESQVASCSADDLRQKYIQVFSDILFLPPDQHLEDNCWLNHKEVKQKAHLVAYKRKIDAYRDRQAEQGLFGTHIVKEQAQRVAQFVENGKKCVEYAKKMHAYQDKLRQEDLEIAIDDLMYKL